MKTRLGFVSNSSSSSYIVAVKRTEPCLNCGRSDPNFIDLIPAYGEGEQTHVVARGLEETIEEMAAAYYHVPDVPTKYYTQENIDKTKLQRDEVIERIRTEAEGYYKDNIALVEISYHDREMQNLFEQGRQHGTIEVIMDWS